MKFLFLKQFMFIYVLVRLGTQIVPIGSGTLISEDLMLIARHSIEGRNLATTKLKASFKNIKQASKHSGMSHYEIEYVESDSELDFAIVKLKGSPGKELDFYEV